MKELIKNARLEVEVKTVSLITHSLMSDYPYIWEKVTNVIRESLQEIIANEKLAGRFL